MDVLTGRFLFNVIKNNLNKAACFLIMFYLDCKVVGMYELSDFQRDFNNWLNMPAGIHTFCIEIF